MFGNAHANVSDSSPQGSVLERNETPHLRFCRFSWPHILSISALICVLNVCARVLCCNRWRHIVINSIATTSSSRGEDSLSPCGSNNMPMISVEQTTGANQTLRVPLVKMEACGQDVDSQMASSWDGD